MIHEVGAIFYPAKPFSEKCKSLFIAEPQSDFNYCNEQWTWKTTKRWLKFAQSLLLFILRPMDTSYLSIFRTNCFRCVFRYFYDVNANTAYLRKAQSSHKMLDTQTSCCLIAEIACMLGNFTCFIMVC